MKNLSTITLERPIVRGSDWFLKQRSYLSYSGTQLQVYDCSVGLYGPIRMHLVATKIQPQAMLPFSRQNCAGSSFHDFWGSASLLFRYCLNLPQATSAVHFGHAPLCAGSTDAWRGIPRIDTAAKLDRLLLPHSSSTVSKVGGKTSSRRRNPMWNSGSVIACFFNSAGLGRSICRSIQATGSVGKPPPQSLLPDPDDGRCQFAGAKQ